MCNKRNKLTLRHILTVSGISKSGYYGYIKQTDSKIAREFNDEEDFELIMKAYRYKGFNKGAKQLKMTLENQFGIIMNLKKIRRLMKKYGLFCPIRKANPYKRMAKAMKTSYVAPNKLERKFKEGNPNQILLTDITYLTYDLNQRAYLSGIKDGVTHEMHGYKASKNLDIRFVEDSVNQLYNISLDPNVLMNSDQGTHYTSHAFQRCLKELGIEQSMSRRGNCWDNAPIESFFGHMKDEINLIGCKTFEEVEKTIDQYMDYYNNYRYQWDLNRMSPKAYGDMLRNKNNKKDGRSKPEQPSYSTDLKY